MTTVEAGRPFATSRLHRVRLALAFLNNYPLFMDWSGLERSHTGKPEDATLPDVDTAGLLGWISKVIFI
jgi:hypothetical protein